MDKGEIGFVNADFFRAHRTIVRATMTVRQLELISHFRQQR